MKITCSDPCCNEVIDFSRHYVRVENRYFCSNDCCLHKLDAERRLAEVGDRFYSPKKKRFQFAGGSDPGDENDYRSQPQKVPIA